MDDVKLDQPELELHNQPSCHHLKRQNRVALEALQGKALGNLDQWRTAYLRQIP